MLHHAFYPHIVDLIFKFAPCESLAVMRAVCSEWRQRALFHMKHLQIDFSSNSYGFPVPVPLAKVAKQCQVLDIGVGTPTWDSRLYNKPDPLSRLQALHELPNPLKTLRLKAPYLDRPRWLPPARSVVFYEFGSTIYYPAPNFEPGARTGAWETMDKLVINHRETSYSSCNDRDKNGTTRCLLSQLKQIVIILHGDGICTHCLFKLLDEALDGDIPVLIVGHETLRRRGQFKPYIVEGHALVQRQDLRKDIRPGVEALTHEEYCELVGRREYDVETSWTVPVPYQTFDLPDNLCSKREVVESLTQILGV